MSNICLRYAEVMFKMAKIFPRLVQDMSYILRNWDLIMHNICLIYAVYMPKFRLGYAQYFPKKCQQYAYNMPKIT